MSATSQRLPTKNQWFENSKIRIAKVECGQCFSIGMEGNGKCHGWVKIIWVNVVLNGRNLKNVLAPRLIKIDGFVVDIKCGAFIVVLLH